MLVVLNSTIAVIFLFLTFSILTYIPHLLIFEVAWLCVYVETYIRATNKERRARTKFVRLLLASDVCTFIARERQKTTQKPIHYFIRMQYLRVAGRRGRILSIEITVLPSMTVERRRKKSPAQKRREMARLNTFKEREKILAMIRILKVRPNSTLQWFDAQPKPSINSIMVWF